MTDRALTDRATTNLEDPGHAVERATWRVLELAGTWLAWDGRPVPAEDGVRLYTPHKAIRRYADHLIDHLAQIEAILAGRPSREDRWLASRVTTEADLARFTRDDLTEATERLTRLATTFRLRLLAAGPATWDTAGPATGDTAGDGGRWTIRQIAEHVADPWYAEQVGDLTNELI
jgi:hypothetical protein